VLRPLALNEIVAETRSLLGEALDRAGAVRFDLAPALPAVEGDPAQVRQVVSNLLTNAAEAVEAEAVAEAVLAEEVLEAAEADANRA